MEGSSGNGKGGLKTIPFIIANEVFEKVAGTGLQANMIIYLTKEFHMSSAASATVLFIWGAASNFTPIFGAYLSDSFLGRFWVIMIGSFTCLFGIVLLWLTTLLPGAKPPACDLSASVYCQPPKPSQVALLFSAFTFMSIGAGGVRPCSLAFGADQLSGANLRSRKLLQTYFNLYYASVGISFMLAVTCIVYIQDKMGWRVGYGIPVGLMVLSAIVFLLGSSLYIKVKGEQNLFMGFVRVISNTFRNRYVRLPTKACDGLYHHRKGSKLVVPSERLRFFNKACIISNAGEEPTRDMSPCRGPSSLCTVEQVEDLKSALRVMPIWSTTIIVSLAISQNFAVLQASTMDRHMGPKFKIPAGSFSVFNIITLTVWSASYDQVVVPVLRKITGNPRGLSLKQRMGIGTLMSIAAMGVAARVEAVRRRTAIKHLGGDVMGTVDMSAMWLVPQHGLTGLAEAFGIIGQIEFYYSELPRSMASFGVALFSLGMGVANLAGTLLIRIVDEVSGRGKKVSWLASNLNQGHYDYYYWVLTLMGAGNFVYFLVCCWAYGEEGKNNVSENEEEEDAVLEQMGHC